MSKRSRNDYILQINQEKGQIPQTWLNLISHDKTQSDSSKNLSKLLEKALTTIPSSVEISSQNYLDLWKMFSNELKTLDLTNTQQIFQRLENVGHLKKNAHFYSCFFKVAVEKKYYEEAKRFLKRGLDNMAQPSAIISSAFKQLSSISLQNRNKENIEVPINQSKNQSPLAKKPSLSELRKTIQTPPTRKINTKENLKKITPVPREKIIEFPKEETLLENSKPAASSSPLKVHNKPKEPGSPLRRKKKK